MAAPSSPRGGLFALSAQVNVCNASAAGGPTITLTNSLFRDPTLDFGVFGVATEFPPDPSGSTVAAPGDVHTTYTLAPTNCKVVMQRTTADADFLSGQNGSDSYPGITVTASAPAGFQFVSSSCTYSDVTFPNAQKCGASNIATRGRANIQHGTQIDFVFGPVPVVEAPVMFVIGDLVQWTLVADNPAAIKAASKPRVGNTVNFWGSQWWKNNPMSQFTTSGWPSFKGYAYPLQVTFPAGSPPCGHWYSRVGNSPPPPATIPDLVGIIITNNVIKNGPDLEGDIQKIVVVRSDGGYSSNPGHDGNGPVVRIVCGGV